MASNVLNATPSYHPDIITKDTYVRMKITSELLSAIIVPRASVLEENISFIVVSTLETRNSNVIFVIRHFCKGSSYRGINSFIQMILRIAAIFAVLLFAK